MSDVDLSKIKDGDQVKIEYLGLTGWQTVEKASSGLWVRPLALPITEPMIVLEHKPAPVTIEVTLPEPKDQAFVARSTLPGKALYLPGMSTRHWTADEAEEYALAILSLVHEARSDQ